MQAFTIKTNKSDYPFMVIADGFKSAVEVLYQKGIYDTSIISMQQMEAVKSDHILIEERLTDREILREEVRRELQEAMPKWMPEPNGAAGGADRDIYLIRTSKGHYFTSSCIGGNNYYLVLDTLEQLPGLPKENLTDDPAESTADIPEAGRGEWQPCKAYQNGDRTDYNGSQYECQGEFKPTDISEKTSWIDGAIRTMDRLISWMIYSMTFCFLFGVAGLDLSVREIIAYSLMLGLVVGSINNIERVMRELFKKED